MKKSPSILSEPGKFSGTIGASSEYRQQREQEQVAGERLRRGVKLGALAAEQAAKSENGYDTKESAVYRLIAHIDSFAEAQTKLDVLQARQDAGHNVARQDKLPHLKEVIKFNHAAKELVNLDSSITFNELSAFITQMYAQQHAFEHADATPARKHNLIVNFENNVQAVLDGMRHELAYEQILGNLHEESVDYEETDEAAELKGVDYFVSYKGQTLGMDVKSSLESTEFSRRKSSNPESKVWSHLSREDFKGGFRISPELAAEKAPLILADLEDAVSAAKAA